MPEVTLHREGGAQTSPAVAEVPDIAGRVPGNVFAVRKVSMSVPRVPPSLAISVGVHAILAILWCVVDLGAPPPPVEVLPPNTEIELVEPPVSEPVFEPPVEFVMLDAAALQQVPVLTAAAIQAPKLAPKATRRPQIAARVIEPEVARPVEPHVPSAYLDFRKGIDLAGRGRDLRIAPSLERIAQGEVAPRSIVETTNQGAIVDPKVRESIVTAEITPGGRGSYKIDDLVFKGKIAPDGSVSLKDKANIQHQFKSWSHIKKVLRTMGPLGLLQLDFDVTDALMRKKKMDPYASRKLAFLDQTRDARVEVGTEYRKQVLARTSEIVRQNLDAMWAHLPDAAARKQALFEMWDEVDETGEEALVEAGKSARAVVVGFIRTRLPRGSAQAFTVDDVTRLNAKRRSRSTFTPYE